MNDLNQTPSANRLHIAIYGRRNSGKSSLINAHHRPARWPSVSDVAGTTADPVLQGDGGARDWEPACSSTPPGSTTRGRWEKLRVEKTRRNAAQGGYRGPGLQPDTDTGLGRSPWLEALKKASGVRVIRRGQQERSSGTRAPLAAARPGRTGAVPAWLVSSRRPGRGSAALLAELTRALPEGLWMRRASPGGRVRGRRGGGAGDAPGQRSPQGAADPAHRCRPSATCWTTAVSPST